MSLIPTSQTYHSLLSRSVDPNDDDPRRDAWLGILVVVAFFVVFLGWACFTRLDAAAFASGEVTVAGHRQTIQHKEGGVVGAVPIKEGQHVVAGQLLVRMASADVESSAQSLSAEAIALQAQQARLQAEEAGRATIAWPASFSTLTGADRDAATQAMQIQQREFSARAGALDAKRRVLRQRSAELSQQIVGYQSQIAATDRQQQLLQDELKGVKELAAKGYAPQTRVRALERNQAELSGQKGQLTANVAQSVQQAGETRLQVSQAEKDQQESIAKELRDVEMQLNDVQGRLKTARDALVRIELRAPVTGTVVGLSVFSAGAVIAPGQKLMDIVPDKAPLVIEATVPAENVDTLHVGQAAEVKFPSVHARGLPILKGSVTRVSADSMVNDKTGARFYTLEVTVPTGELALLQKYGGEASLRPGLPAQVVIPLRKRTALDYLLDPLAQALFGSFRER